MPSDSTAAPAPRPSPAVVRALGRGAGWAMFLGLAYVATNALGMLSLLFSVGQLTVLPLPIASVTRWLTLFGVLLGLAPIACGVLLTRYASAARRLGPRATFAEVESALTRLATYWHWSALTLLASVLIGIVFLFVVAAAVAVAR